MVKLSKDCAECGVTFYKGYYRSLSDWNSKAKYCSVICSHKNTLLDGSKQPTLEQRARGERNNKWKGGQVEKTCLTCKQSYKVDPYRVEQTKTCSRECFKILHKTKEFRLKCSNSVRNGINAEFYKLTATFAKFKNLLRRCSRYNIWRFAVMERDNYICQLCERRGGKLCVDHIEPFISIVLKRDIKTYEQALVCEELWDIDNGRTLCLSCHYKTPTFGSKVHRALSAIIK